MNKINELFFAKLNNTSEARSVKEKLKKMVQLLSEREEPQSEYALDLRSCLNF